MTSDGRSPAEVEAALATRPAGTPPPDPFREAEIAGLPDLVQRFLRGAIAPGAPMTSAVRLTMRGSIKVGRWVPFTSREILDPHRGFVWSARAAWLLTGSDHYLDGQGAMAFSLLGRVPVVQGDGADLARSAAGRAGAEACWAPTALLPRFGVGWEQAGPSEIVSHHRLDEVDLDVHWIVDEAGRLRSSHLARWGDPDGSGTYGMHPFGMDVTAHATFQGLTVPSRGRAGWFHGTDRWAEGEFFRFEITDVTPVR